MTLKTKNKIKREKRDQKLREAFQELSANPANMRSAIIDELMRVGNCSMATVYRAIK